MKNMIWIGLGVLVVVIVIGALVVYLGVVRSIENYYFGADKDILEFSEVTNFVATAKGQGADRVLEISGLSMNSSLVVNKLYTSQKESVLNIRISQILARENMSGSFDYEIPIPEGSVSAVTFGNDKAQIWTDDTAKGGGLTGEPGDQNAEPIGSIEMDMEGNLILAFFNSPEEEVTKLAPSDPNYQKWIVHVGGIKPGEKKSIPPLAR